MQKELKKVLENVLETDFVSDTDSAETLKTWDSVRHLSLIAALEERFGVTFEAEEMMELTSVKAISEALQKRNF